jgi:hypothetical protein
LAGCTNNKRWPEAKNNFAPESGGAEGSHAACGTGSAVSGAEVNRAGRQDLSEAKDQLSSDPVASRMLRFVYHRGDLPKKRLRSLRRFPQSLRMTWAFEKHICNY